jgi:hypothetical protein
MRERGAVAVGPASDSGSERSSRSALRWTTSSWISVGQWTNLYENYTWERGHTNWFRPTVSQVVIRVSLLATSGSAHNPDPIWTGHVDDFNLTCTY